LHFLGRRRVLVYNWVLSPVQRSEFFFSLLAQLYLAQFSWGKVAGIVEILQISVGQGGKLSFSLNFILSELTAKGLEFRFCSIS